MDTSKERARPAVSRVLPSIDAAYGVPPALAPLLDAPTFADIKKSDVCATRNSPRLAQLLLDLASL